MKNKILKGITGAAATLAMVAICFLDSENYLPFLAVLVICFVWLELFYHVNKDIIEREL